MNSSTRVVIAPLGRRFVAWLVDRVVPTALGVVFVLVNWVWLPDAWLVHDVVITVALVSWVMAQWWAYGTRGAGLGYRVVGLRLVRLSDGRPLGWGPMFLRTLILQTATAFVIPGLVLAVMLVIQERRQGWMDLAVGSVTIRPQPRVPAGAPTASRPVTPRLVVGLPAHLTEPGFTQPAGPITPAAPAVPDPVAPTRLVEHTPFSVPIQPVAAGPHVTAGPVGAPPARTTVPPPVQRMTAQPSQGAAAPRIRPRAFSDETEEGTRLVTGPQTRGGDEGWALRLDDGRQVPLAGTVLIGRDPAPRPTDGPVTLLVAGEPSRTVSKTHLSVGVDGRGAFLVDRGSTNGTAVRDPSGDLQPCPADQTVRLAEGQVVSFGERTFQVIRRRP